MFKNPLVTVRAASRTVAGLAAGFSLIELAVTLVVAAVLFAIVAPNLRTYIQDSRIDTATSTFFAAVQRARSEAVTRGDAVILCRTANPATDTCGDSDAEDWTPGWLMYAVPNFGGEVDYDEDNHQLIQRGSAAPEGVTITSDNHGNSWLTFGPDGTLSEDGPLAYAICDDRGESAGQLIVIPLTGRPRVAADMDEAPGCEPN